MPANAAIYLTRESVDLAELFPQAKSNKTWLRAASQFEIVLGTTVVRFNVMPKKEMKDHLMGFVGYVGTLDDEEQRLQDAVSIIPETKLVLGMVCDADFDDNDAIWPSLFQIAEHFDGFVFVYDSIILSTGAVLVGPLRALDEDGSESAAAPDEHS